MRARQDRAERITHAALEAAVRVSGLVERHQRIDVFGGHGATERAPREVLDNLARARGFIARPSRSADEDLRPARRLAHAGDIERSADLQRVRRLDALLTCFERDRSRPLVALWV